MHTIHTSILIQAPIERCFDLARDMDLHVQSARHTGEKAVAGVTTGLLTLGDQVTFEARHLGVRQRLTSHITIYDRPRHFRDSVTQSAFQSMEHDHYFDQQTLQVTRMTDVITFAAPCPPLGWLAERILLGWYLKRFIKQRARAIKDAAESPR